MLIQFLVENFLSFKDETVFSMLAPPGETRAVVEIPSHGLRLMRMAAFYGANASGKSNLIKAMETARELISREQAADAKLPARAFRLDPATKSKPSRFQFDFITEGIRYTYILAFTRDAITAEALYRQLPNASEEEMVYEREAPENKGEHRVVLGPMFDARSEEDRQFARFTARGAHVREPLLAKFDTGNVLGFAAIRAWFTEGLKVIDPIAPYPNLVSELHSNAPLREFFAKTLSMMGTGIRGVKIEKTNVPALDDGMISTRVLRFLPTLSAITVDKESGGTILLELRFEHANRAGIKTLFKLKDESDGTQRLLHLLPVLFHRTKESGLCTVIDELDRSLHTSLTRHFVQEFLNMASDTRSQLIFTTHDTNLLNGRLLPPRAIWFVEKDDDGASRIHSLSEYKPEQLEHLLEHLEEGYLQGRFGAIPFLASRDSLAWQSNAEKPEA